MKHEGTKFVCESCYEDLLWYLLKVPKTCAYCLDVHPAC